MKTKKAFTLVELLVVVSIIALLLAVLIPSLSRAKELARMIVCRANEKTLVTGARVWSEDHEGWTIAVDWYKNKGENEEESSLGPYIGADKDKLQTAKVCPTAKFAQFERTDPHYDPCDLMVTYAVNGFISYNFWNGDKTKCYSPGRTGPKPPESGQHGSGLGGFDGGGVFWTVHGMNKLDDIRRPTETVYFIDHQYYFTAEWLFNPLLSLAELKRNCGDSTYNEFVTRWHKRPSGEDYGIGNIGWVDGHVSVEPRDFKQGDKSDKATQKWRYYFYNH